MISLDVRPLKMIFLDKDHIYILQHPTCNLARRCNFNLKLSDAGTVGPSTSGTDSAPTFVTGTSAGRPMAHRYCIAAGTAGDGSAGLEFAAYN